MRLKQVGRMQICGKFFVGKQCVNLFVTRRANVDSRAEVLPVTFVFSLGVLLRGEVVDGEFGTRAIAQLANRIFA